MEAQADGRGDDGRVGGSGPNGHASSVSADAQAIMACMSEGFASLQQSIKELTETLTRPDRSTKQK